MKLSKHIKLLIIAISLAACINSNASALSRLSKKGLIKVAFTPLQIGIIGNLFETKNVYGLSFALPMSYAKNTYGYASGFWSNTNKLKGVQFNLVNLATELDGVQFGFVGIVDNYKGSDSEVAGIQFNIVNLSETLFGFQSGIFNQSERLNGMQSGFVNIADQGLQFGFTNFFNSKEIKDVDSNQCDARIQIGLYNHSNNSAFQIGAFNYNKKGFLPFFILFNFSID